MSDARQIVIAIDGYSSCGKSTLAKDLANSLHYLYIDSGAMYRAFTLHLLRNRISLYDQSSIQEALHEMDIHFQRIGNATHTFLNQEDVEQEIRTMEVSNFVSQVATLQAVRKAMVKKQKAWGVRKGVVMDGRDIGTVVFPNAELKLFLVADMEVRVERRFLELRARGKAITRKSIRQNLYLRDYIDATRSFSPLLRAEDAVEINNTNLLVQEQLALALTLVSQRAR